MEIEISREMFNLAKSYWFYKKWGTYEQIMEVRNRLSSMCEPSGVDFEQLLLAVMDEAIYEENLRSAKVAEEYSSQ